MAPGAPVQGIQRIPPHFGKALEKGNELLPFS